MQTEIDVNESDIDLNQKWSEIDLNECEHFLKASWDRSKIDLNECEHFLKVNWDVLKGVWTLSQSKLRSIWDRSNEGEHFLKANWDRSELVTKIQPFLSSCLKLGDGLDKYYRKLSSSCVRIIHYKITGILYAKPDWSRKNWNVRKIISKKKWLAGVSSVRLNHMSLATG